MSGEFLDWAENLTWPFGERSRRRVSSPDRRRVFGEGPRQKIPIILGDSSWRTPLLFLLGSASCSAEYLHRLIRCNSAVLVRIVGSGRRQRAVACRAATMQLLAETQGALEAARALEAPRPEARLGGEAEHSQFWQRHDGLLRRAWREYGRLHPEVYTMHEGCLDPQLLEDLELIKHSPEQWMAQRETAAPGVYRLRVFRPEVCQKLLEEVEHLQASGIPTRRPNGMNRYGLILSDVGLGPMLSRLMAGYMSQLGAQAFPEWIGPDGSECRETYGFSVRYAIGEDTGLAEHTDASNLTLNLCLGRDFNGGNLYFKGVRYTDTEGQETRAEVQHSVGEGLLHLGGHQHCALPITSGTRVNLILWATMAGGTVRIRRRGCTP